MGAQRVGGREDEAAASLLKQMNAVVREHFPGFVVAEELDGSA